MSTEPCEQVALFVARLRAELDADAGLARAVPDLRRAYREAACLLPHFDPLLLSVPDGAGGGSGAALELLDDCTTTGSKEQAVWSLKAEVRDATLRSLAGPGAALAALERNIGAAREDPGAAHLCLAYLRGGPPPPVASAGELADALQAVLWLSRVPGTSGLPDPARLQHDLERARLLQPLERLVRQPFQGRARELAALGAYACGSGAAAGPGEPPAPVPPLVIHGPGGMGKSTLLAAFLLGGIRDHPSGFPFAYIDFERPTLSVHEPATVLAEMARQLGIQYPAHQEDFDALGRECRNTARSQREGEERVTQLHRLATTRPELGRGSSRLFQTLATERETDLNRRVAGLLRRAVAETGQGEAPFLVVVDSFEKAQYRSSPVLGRMWTTCAAFQTVYPRLRVVISGRSSVEHPLRFRVPPEIELAELDPRAAVGLLTSCGVEDPGVARELAARVGGHPLSLKLAARAAVLAGAEGEGELIRALPVRRDDVFRRVDQMLVQGILYDRILHHIADPDVRRLARPGLVLRVITPEIVKEVLAQPCGLRVRDEEEARALFEKLSRLDLMEPAGPLAVRHRGDVRAIMLRLPGSDRTEVMREVERRAVAYYAARDDVEARAEEIYHRLRLGEHPRAVEERWLPGVERHLAGALADMPRSAAALLTARLGGEAGEAGEEVLQGADQEDWERITAREVEDFLAQGLFDVAAERLAERRPWTPCSPLHPLLAETLDGLGRRDEARGAVDAALASARDGGCAERRLELLLLSARLREDTGDPAGADRDLRQAEDIAVGLGQDLEAMGALLARARLTARAGGADEEAAGQLAHRLRLTPDAVLADQPVLVRAVASQVYTRDPDVLAHAVEVVGMPTDDEALATLGTAIQAAVTRQPTLLKALMDLLREAAGPSKPPQPGARPRAGSGQGPGSGPSSITGILRLARDRGTLNTLARRLLAVPDRSGVIAAAVAATMGSGTAERPAGAGSEPPPGGAGPEGRGPVGPGRP